MTSPSRRHPAVAGMFGAICTAPSAAFVALSGTTTGTACFYRCALALPVLLVFARVERRRRGGLTRRQHAVALAAGALLGGDLLLWSQAIGEVGAGVSTVVVNLQVVLVPLIALIVDRERLDWRLGLIAVPMLAGVALAAGLGFKAFGPAPVLGTAHAALAAICYAGYLVLLRRGGTTGRLAGPVLELTVSAGAVSLLVGAVWHGVSLLPGWSPFGWLIALALTGPVAGGLLLGFSLPRLTSGVGAALLVLQPAGAVLLGYVLLDQRPSPVQLAGCALVLVAVLCTTALKAPDRSAADRTPSGLPVQGVRGPA